MQINLSSAALATFVWNNTTRTLTSISANAINGSASSSNVGAGATVDFRPVIGARQRQISMVADSATGCQFGMWDGSTTISYAPPSSFAYCFGIAVNAVGTCYKNGDASAHNLRYAFWEWN